MSDLNIGFKITDELIQSLIDRGLDNELIKQLVEEKQTDEERDSAPYNGILGQLPQWMPTRIKADFKRNQFWVLDAWGISIEEAIYWIEGCPDTDNQIDHIDLKSAKTFPSGSSMDRVHFGDVIEVLSNIKWATSIEPDAGLYFLCGEYAMIGYRSKNNLKPRAISDLTILAEQTYRKLAKSQKRQPSGKDVIAALCSHDKPTNPIIQEIDWTDEIIFWRTNKGSETKTGFNQFYNKLTPIRKLHSG